MLSTPWKLCVNFACYWYRWFDGIDALVLYGIDAPVLYGSEAPVL